MDTQTTAPSNLPFTVSVVQNTAPEGRLCKIHEYDEATEELRSRTDGILYQGSVRVETFESIESFMEFRSGLRTNEALVMGHPIFSPATIRTQSALRGIDPDSRRAERIIARDREHFPWSDAPSVVMFDVDHDDDVPDTLKSTIPSDPEGLRELILECVPGLKAAPMAWAPSSSSCIYHGDTQLRGLRGQRFYAVVESGQAIEQFRSAFRNALALKGLVWYKVSKSGALLKRYPFDLAVYRPEHLDFAAGPECEPPLKWRPGAWRTWNEDGPYLRQADLPSFTDADLKRIDHLRQERRRDRSPEAKDTKERWTEETGRRIALHHKDLDPAKAATVARQAVDRGVLLPEFILTDEEGESVRVGELLANPSEHDGRRFHDPLEPDYRDDPRIAVFLADEAGRCRIFSHAHGGQWWRCETKIIQVRLGLIEESVDEIRAGLHQDHCDLYRHGDTIVHVDSAAGDIQTLDAEGLALRIQRRFDVLRRTKQGGWAPANIPRGDLLALMSETASLPIPPLTVVTTGPFARADGSAVDSPGYDPATGVLYLSKSDSPPRARRNIGVTQAEDALRTLFDPFAGFPFKTELDRGVFLAALLSALTRLSVQTAPGYLITAPAAGSGKTTLAETIGALQTGSRIACSLMPDSDEEMRKQVFAALRDGSTFIAYDNLERGSRLNSPVLAGLITSPDIGQRVLGYSANERRPNRMTMVFTGNNIVPDGDLVRRVLPITLDPGLEHPERRTFDFDPVARVLSDFIPLRIAALEVIRGWRDDGADPPPDAIGFSEWNAVVRGPVLWVAKHLDIGVGFGDPGEAMRLGYSEDSESQPLGDLFEAWHDHFGDREVLLKEIAEAIEQADLDEFPTSSNPDVLATSCTTRQRLAEARRAAVPESTSSTVFGRYLDDYKGRVVRGLQLVKGGMTGGSRRWSVRRVEEAAEAA